MAQRTADSRRIVDVFSSRDPEERFARGCSGSSSRSSTEHRRHHDPGPPIPVPPDWQRQREDGQHQQLFAGGTTTASVIDEEEDKAETELSEDEEVGEAFLLQEEGPNRDPLEMATWTGMASIRGSSEAVRMVLLTFVMIGITFTWGIEMTYCTPYLLSLGLTKSKISLVWIAGPLSGLIVQPIVGAISDESTSRWGRRRPLILACAAAVATSLLVLGFTAELVGMVIADQEAAKTPTVVVAVLAIYAVDFAINAVMSCSRSLIVDTLSLEKQQAGAAWASRIGALGHVIGYGMGAVDMVSLFGTTFGDTQFKQLTVMAATGMVVCSSVTCWAVTERVLLYDPVRHRAAGGSRFKFVRQIWTTLSHLPPRVRAICWAQFWSWIGWFPFLFYSTTWVGETYFRYDLPKIQGGKEGGGDDLLGDIGRIGSSSLVIYSSVTFLGAWLLPLVVRSPEDEAFTARPPESIKGFLETWEKYKPDLLTAWIGGHLLFAAAMFFAPFATSYRFATVLVAICGIPWAIAMWAPVTFLGMEVNRLSGGGSSSSGPSTSSGGSAAYRRLSNASIELSSMERPRVSSSTTATATTISPTRLENGGLLSRHDVDGGPDGAGAGGAKSEGGELSGIYFGILNIYTTLPQFVGTFISAVVFAIMEPGKSPELANDAPPEEHHGTDGTNAIAVCLFIGACCAVIAARATRRLRDVQ